MYTYTASGVPLIVPPIVAPTALQGLMYVGHHSPHPAYTHQQQSHTFVSQHRPAHSNHQPPQPRQRYTSDAPRYDPNPSVEYTALYERNDGKNTSYGHSHSGGHGHSGGQARTHDMNAAGHGHDAHTSSRAQPRLAGHRVRLAQEEREHDRGRTQHRHERRSTAVSEASHTATIGTLHQGTGHSSRTQQHQAPRAPVTAGQHQSSSHNYHHATGHGHTRPSPGPSRPTQAHQHHSSHRAPAHSQYPNEHSYSLGVSYVPTTAPSGARTPRPRAKPSIPNIAQRARSRSEPRHRTLRPQRSAMKSRSRSRPGPSRSRSHGRVHWPGRDVPVGERNRSRGPGVSFNWGRH